jgi:hypothetical protein
MSQAGYTPIQLYYSTTAAAVPVNTNLANGELAINITDGKLYYKDNTGTVKLLAGATAGPAGGSNTQVQFNSSGVLAGSANMTFDGTTLTVNDITDSSLTVGRVTFAGTAGNLTDSANLFWDNTNARLGLNTTTPSSTLHVKRTAGSSTITIDYNGTNIGRAEANSNGNLYFGLTTGSGSVSIGTTSVVDAIYVASAGNVGIGTTSPAQKLDVVGTVQAAGTHGAGSFNAYIIKNLLNSSASGKISWQGSTSVESWAIAQNQTVGANFLEFNYLGANQAVFNSSGNFGLGVSPSAWSGIKAFEFGTGTSNGSLYSFGNDTTLSANVYYNGGFKYISTATATRYQQSTGQHIWYNAASGTAGNAITFTQAMTLDASGNLGIANTTPSSYNAVADNLVIGTSGSNGLTIVAGTANDGSIHFADGTSGADAYRGQIFYSHAGNYMVFGTDAVERMRIASTGQMSTTNGAGVVALAYDARAWVNFNGTGTVAIRGSANVSSITDNGTGDYTVNFTTAMSDANYSVVASSSYSANGARGSVWAEPYAVSTSAARILTSGAAALFDVASVTAAIFR